MIRIKKINNEVVKPVALPVDLTCKKIKGSDLFPDPYCNIGLIARKKSGKSSAIFKILKKKTGKNTTLIFFVSTIHKDPTWIEIVKYFENKGNTVISYTSLNDEGGNQLEELIQYLNTQRDDEEEEEEEIKVKPACLIRCDDDEEEEEEKKPRKPKYIASDYICVFDDLSTELKNKSIVSLLKKNRHYKMSCILSTQYIHDISPEALKQLDYWLIFKGQPKEKLELIYKHADLSIPYELFEYIYYYATREKYSFLYIDTQQQKFRRSFNCEFNIPDY